MDHGLTNMTFNSKLLVSREKKRRRNKPLTALQHNNRLEKTFDSDSAFLWPSMKHVAGIWLWLPLVVVFTTKQTNEWRQDLNRGGDAVWRTFVFYSCDLCLDLTTSSTSVSDFVYCPMLEPQPVITIFLLLKRPRLRSLRWPFRDCPVIWK